MLFCITEVHSEDEINLLAHTLMEVL
jgi:hypothetical protein